MTLDAARREGVLTLTLRRPERRNALDHALFAALTGAFAAFAADPAARVLVITGEGSAFCSGIAPHSGHRSGVAHRS